MSCWISWGLPIYGKDFSRGDAADKRHNTDTVIPTKASIPSRCGAEGELACKRGGHRRETPAKRRRPLIKMLRIGVQPGFQPALERRHGDAPRHAHADLPEKR